MGGTDTLREARVGERSGRVTGFWAGGTGIRTPSGTVIAGQMYVEHHAPPRPDGRPPVVLVHGGGGQGLEYVATPDGRPGWAPLLADRGYDAYVVDRPGHGRSPYDPQVLGPPAPTMGAEAVASLFFPPPEGEGSHPASAAHTQWPGGRDADDPVTRQFLAALGPMPADSAAAQRLEQAAMAALLDRTGPAVVVAHSAGAPAGYLAADARPGLVRALVAVEPLGPPFLDRGGLRLAWGVTNAPLAFDPPAAGPGDLVTAVRGSGSPVPVVLQAEPARRLPQLARVPIVLVSAEASPLRWLEEHTRAFLEQAGCTVSPLRLFEEGVHGNAHGMMLEKNNAEVLDVILARVAEVTGTGG